MLGETLVPASTEISHAENHRMRTPKAQPSHVENPVEGVSSSERVDPQSLERFVVEGGGVRPSKGWYLTMARAAPRRSRVIQKSGRVGPCGTRLDERSARLR
jgi:hypothetical protein